jgi:hypothetical protein
LVTEGTSAALHDDPGVRRWTAPGGGAWFVAVVAVLVAAVIIAVVNVDRSGEPSASSTIGSGVSVTDRREAGPFNVVELAGANTVVIHVGAPRSVAVTGDDNLVPRVTTVVQDGRLVIDNTGSFTTNADMSVAVSVPSLESVKLGGAGTVTVDGVASEDFSAELTGDGTLVASGNVERLTVVLAGAGTLDLHDLVAADGTVQLEGTGTIRVHATTTLDTTLTGTGTILYRGDPAVTMHQTGTGTVVAE